LKREHGRSLQGIQFREDRNPLSNGMSFPEKRQSRHTQGTKFILTRIKVLLSKDWARGNTPQFELLLWQSSSRREADSNVPFPSMATEIRRPKSSRLRGDMWKRIQGMSTIGVEQRDEFFQSTTCPQHVVAGILSRNPLQPGQEEIPHGRIHRTSPGKTGTDRRMGAGPPRVPGFSRFPLTRSPGLLYDD